MRRTTAIVAGLAAVLVVVGPLAWLRGWLAPMVRAATATLAPDGRTSADAPDEVLREQVAHLGAENAVLRARLADYAAIQGEGGVPPERVVVARGRIIARTRRAGRRYLELDVGRVDGVAKGMAVTIGWTLVGQVAGSDDGRCLVQELTDSDSRVAAVVLSASKKPAAPEKPAASETSIPPEKAAEAPTIRLCEGVLAGTGKSQSLSLEFVDGGGDLELLAGQAVVTAGSDGRFPATLVLGTIVSASHAGTTAWQVVVAPARDPDAAESVLVVRYLAP